MSFFVLTLLTLNSFLGCLSNDIFRLENCWDSELSYNRLAVVLNQKYLEKSDVDTINNDLETEINSIYNTSKKKIYTSCIVYNGKTTISTKKNSQECNLIGIDNEFLDFFKLHLIKGRLPDENNQAEVVLSEDLAGFLFGTTDVLSKDITINDSLYTVVGITNSENENNAYISYFDSSTIPTSDVYNTCLYCIMPKVYDGYSEQILGENIPEKVTVINVSNWYKFYYQLKMIITSEKDYYSNEIPIQLLHEYRVSKQLFYLKISMVILSITFICLCTYWLVKYIHKKSKYNRDKN